MEELHMKKATAAFLLALCMLSITACQKTVPTDKGDTGSTSDVKAAAEDTVADTQKAPEGIG